MNTVVKLQKEDESLIKENTKNFSKDDISNLAARLHEFVNKVGQWKENDEINIAEQEQYKKDFEKLENIIGDCIEIINLAVIDKKLTKEEKLNWLNDLKSKFDLGED